MLGKAGNDANPEMKVKVVTFAADLARELKQHKIGQYMRMVVVTSTNNLQH